MQDEGNRADSSDGGAARKSSRLEVAVVALGYTLLTALLYHNVFGRLFDHEDFFISGLGTTAVGSPVRLAQSFFISRICRPLFLDTPLGYNVVSLALHTANAFLVYAVFILFFRKSNRDRIFFSSRNIRIIHPSTDPKTRIQTAKKYPKCL